MAGSILSSITITTDIDNFPLSKKASLFKELEEKTKSGTGTLSKESRFVISKLYKAFVDICNENSNLKSENRRLSTVNTQLLEKQSSLAQSSPLSYTNQHNNRILM